MPMRDGTGPMGAGSMTGRQLGSCPNANPIRPAWRFGFGRGLGRGIILSQNSSKTQKELLQEQKNVLKNQLEAIDKQLESL